MRYFVVYALDKPGMAQVRSENRSAHRARLRDHDHPITVRVGGPLLGAEDAMIGTLLVIEAEDAEQVRAFVDGDPYARAGLYERVDIHPFNWGLGKPEEAGA